MLEQKDIQLIEEIIINFFNEAGYQIDLETSFNENILEINILNIEDSNMFIGKQGIILADLQLLLRKIIKRNLEKEIFLNLDIDNYKKNKINNLKSMANSIAEEVLLINKDKLMPPLSAYARRIIHMELADRENIQTESISISGERRLVIKPKNS